MYCVGGGVRGIAGFRRHEKQQNEIIGNDGTSEERDGEDERYRTSASYYY